MNTNKSKQFKYRDDMYRKIRGDLFGLIQPTTHKINITNGQKFSKDMKQLLSRYVTSITPGLDMFRQDVLEVPYRQPLYGEFLVGSSTLSNNEPLGCMLFLFKQEDNGSSIDSLLTLTSLFKISGAGAEASEWMFKIANVWYGQESNLEDMVPNIQQLIQDGLFHTHLTPVGPMIQNIQSTFVNKITSVVKGEVLSKDPPQQNIKLVVPVDLFLDVDAMTHQGVTLLPSRLHVCYYFVITYVIQENTPIMLLHFIKSNKALSQLVLQLKLVYGDAIRHKFVRQQQDFYINRMTFGALCRVGYSSTSSDTNYKNLQFKGSSLPVVEIPDFISDPGPWTVFL
nr:assembly DNA maturation protein [Bovine gammaherpesvirus 4]